MLLVDIALDLFWRTEATSNSILPPAAVCH
jgi:hypothetical protein